MRQAIAVPEQLLDDLTSLLGLDAWAPVATAAADRRIVRNHIAYTGPVVIDARMKPWYPKELSCRDDVARTVTQRWNDYFPNGRVEMGDAERGHLD